MAQGEADRVALHVKVECNGNIRRLSLGTNFSFGLLRSKMISLFGPFGDREASLCFSYYDNDGDLVTLSSDAELHEAADLMCDGGLPLRLILTTEPDAAAAIPKTKPASSTTAPPQTPTQSQAGPSSQTASTPRGPPRAGRHGPCGPGRRGGGGGGRWMRGVRGPGGPSGFGPGPFGFPPPPGGPFGGYPPPPGGSVGPHPHPPPHGRFPGGHYPPPPPHGGPGEFLRMFGVPFLPGALLHKLHRMGGDIPPEVRSAWHAFMEGMMDSDEISELGALVPALFLALQALGSAMETAGVDEPDDQMVADLVTSLTNTLSGTLSEANVNNFLALATSAVSWKQFGKVVRWISRNIDSAYAYEAAADNQQRETQASSTPVDDVASVQKIVDDRAWEKAPSHDGSAAPSAPLYVGDSGSRVEHLHAALIQVGTMSVEMFNPARLSAFGQHTELALKDFQQQHGLDGMVTPGAYEATTRASLLSILESRHSADDGDI